MHKLTIVLFAGLLCAACEPKTETTSPDEASSHEAHHPEAADAEPADESSKHEGMAHACPMKVPNTKPSVEEIEGGVALVFATDAEGVDELRERARKMASMHAKHHGGNQSPEEGGMHHGEGKMKVPPSTATAEDTETGARVVFKPIDAAQLQALRDHMAKMAAKMQSGECPMKGHHRGHES